MSYIGKHKRTTKRPVPQPIQRPTPVPKEQPAAPDRISVPNWPVQAPIPVELPQTQKAGRL